MVNDPTYKITTDGVIFTQNYPLPSCRAIRWQNVPLSDILNHFRHLSLHEWVGAYLKQIGEIW